MALPLKPGLMPTEVAFLCEMEMVTVIPRQRLDSLELLGGPTKPLTPPFPTTLPLWLALLLKRQRRANIQPPPWLHPTALSAILEIEVQHDEAFSPGAALTPVPSTQTSSRGYTHPRQQAGGSVGGGGGGGGGRGAEEAHTPLSPPFVPTSTSHARADALPYHWLELSTLLLDAAGDDVPDADAVRRLVRDLRDVRLAKLRRGVGVLDAGAGVQMNGVGALEVAGWRGFVCGVVDGLRKIGASREQARRDQGSEDDGEDGYRGAEMGGVDHDDEDDDML